MFSSDISLEISNQTSLKVAIDVCEEKKDFATREIFTKILDDTEERIDWIETQQSLIDKVGLENYLQQNFSAG